MTRDAFPEGLTPYGPTPTDRQLAWHSHPYYGFLHFTVNTFTDQEWGYGDEAASVFSPTAFDADQIAEAAANAGMSGLILTAKHHDGFCLWPSRFTEHSVRNASWRMGQGDVVREVSEACGRAGLRFGVYLSPWDRNQATYGTPRYREIYLGQLRELLTEYGPLFEVWFDGANGGDGYYGGAREARLIDKRTYYGWQGIHDLVRELQPDASIFSDAGPDVRWVGNERGIAGDPCWATLNRDDFWPGESDADRLNRGDRPGTHWVPAECDVSIRPGWFYHPSEDGAVKSGQRLLDLYLQSVGRGAALLLNVPPDRRGQLSLKDVAALDEFRQLREALFAEDLAAHARRVVGPSRAGLRALGPANLVDGDPKTYWATDDAQMTPEMVVELAELALVGAVEVWEYLPLGQRVEGFAIALWHAGAWVEAARGTSIGARRIAHFEPRVTDRVRLRVTAAAKCPALSRLAVWRTSG